MDQLYLFSGSLRTILIEKSTFRRFGPFWKEGQKGLLEKREYDEAGRLCKIEKSDYFEYPAYLEEKRPAALYRFNRDDELIYREVFFYNGQGHREFREIYDRDIPKRTINYEENQGVILEKEGNRIRGSQWDKQGRLVSEYLYHGTEADLITKYTYQEKGLLRKEKQDKRGNLVQSTDYTLNENGLILEEIVKNSQKNVIYHRIFQYPRGDDANWLVREEYGLNRHGKKNPLSLIFRSLNFYHIPEPKSNIQVKTQTQTSPVPITDMAKVGTIPFANGYYKGEINGDNMEGKGVFFFNDGRVYEGDFHEGRMEGRGSLKGKDGSNYRGDFLRGKMHGKGVLVWQDKSRYEGPFNKGLMNGVGIFTWPNGDRFKGLFESGRRTDQGLVELSE